MISRYRTQCQVVHYWWTCKNIGWLCKTYRVLQPCWNRVPERQHRILPPLACALCVAQADPDNTDNLQWIKEILSLSYFLSTNGSIFVLALLKFCSMGRSILFALQHDIVSKTQKGTIAWIHFHLLLICLTCNWGI